MIDAPRNISTIVQRCEITNRFLRRMALHVRLRWQFTCRPRAQRHLSLDRSEILCMLCNPHSTKKPCEAGHSLAENAR